MGSVTSVILRRLGGMLVVMLAIVTVTFVIVRLTPGDPAAMILGDQATVQDIADLRERMGLDRPILEQYATYVLDAAQGDLGQSLFLGVPVLDAIAGSAETTIFLTLFAILIAVAIALPVGIISAYKRGSVIDQIAVAVSMLASSVPSFWLGLILIQTFAVSLGWFPTSGYGGPGAGFATRMGHLLLPAVALGVVNSALILRFTRAAMLDVLSEDYIRTARAKGMVEKRVVMRHALKNALIPIITVVGLSVALLISGAVVTETVFGLPGIGNLTVNAVMRRDYPVIQGTLLVVAGVYVLINFLVDMLYILVDPRVRL
ncbi:ABC transporter permease [Falsirhodobacter sp. 20TX0035]|uniref:ABC transporter permease n=1 Tax=Falsirhodobacter sp. 20TX0035 TaxID=3022019 RepID=UPI00232AFAD8|nr:ABC transporter permease [Falsirhodobacter sp. 20TX0035]MDB6454190.1 ABC transporter permease [Falsirhodobacter sp. 20TX0035]